MNGTKTKSTVPSPTVKIYLISYNLFQSLGWSVILAMSLNHFITKKTNIGVYDTVHIYLKVFQTLQTIEMLHILIGIVRSPLATNFIQIGSRLAVVWPALYLVPEVTNNFSVSMVLVAWSIAEITRYLYYATALLGHAPYFLVWCRYNLFLILYPIGVTGEIWLVISSIPYIRSKSILTLEMPNPLNFSFHLDLALAMFILCYVPGFPLLFSHMLSQRKKFNKESKSKLT